MRKPDANAMREVMGWLGSRGGSKKSPAKARAARLNGRKGGRPLQPQGNRTRGASNGNLQTR